jgi:hypothetical protein
VILRYDVDRRRSCLGENLKSASYLIDSPHSLLDLERNIDTEIAMDYRCVD